MYPHPTMPANYLVNSDDQERTPILLPKHVQFQLTLHLRAWESGSYSLSTPYWYRSCTTLDLKLCHVEPKVMPFQQSRFRCSTRQADFGLPWQFTMPITHHSPQPQGINKYDLAELKYFSNVDIRDKTISER